MKLRNLILFGAAAVVCLGADMPYVGKWKMNIAQSDFGETTITYQSLPGGEWQATSDGLSYKFKMDGKDVPDPFGETAAWKSVDATHWETVWKFQGKVMTTDTLNLGADGSTLTVTSKGAKPNGEAIDDMTVLRRVSGGPGLDGKWKFKNMKSSSPDIVEFVKTADGIAFKEPAYDLTCESKMDGKDFPCTGATLGPGWTSASNPAGPRSLHVVVKKDAKLLYDMTYTVSEDGKTMTEIGGALASGEKIKVVYDRQ